jgi:hypothetical protein
MRLSSVEEVATGVATTSSLQHFLPLDLWVTHSFLSPLLSHQLLPNKMLVSLTVQ